LHKGVITLKIPNKGLNRDRWRFRRVMRVKMRKLGQIRLKTRDNEEIRLRTRGWSDPEPEQGGNRG
jgi:hypothetical protein